MIEGVVVTPLRIIRVSGGDVLHAMKADDTGFFGFGESYFSMIEPSIVKGWKRHREMTLNLVVPVGEIRFVIFDDRNVDNLQFQEIILSKAHYCRLTIPPMVWTGFQCVGRGASLLLNIANIPHVPTESDKKALDEIEFDWTWSSE